MLESEMFDFTAREKHSILQYPMSSMQDIRGSVPATLARELGTVWQRGEPVAKPYEACQIMEDTGKVLLASVLDCSGSVNSSAIPKVIKAAEAIKPDWEPLDTLGFVRTIQPRFRWLNRGGSLNFEQPLSASIGAIVLARTLETMVRNAQPLEEISQHDSSPFRKQFYLTYRFPVHQPAQNKSLIRINNQDIVSDISVTTPQGRWETKKKPLIATASDFTIKLESHQGVETLSYINASLSAHQDTEYALGELHASQAQLRQVNGTMLSLPDGNYPAGVVWKMVNALQATKHWKRLSIARSNPEADD